MIIDNVFILIMGLILFSIGIFTAYITNTTWLYMISGLLWFIPLFMIDNIFILIFSVTMIIFWSTLSFKLRRE